MKQIAVLCVLCFLTLAPTAADAQPIEVIDQVQAGLAGPTVTVLAIGGLSEQRLAQTVTAGVDGRLNGVLLPIVGCADGVLRVDITTVEPDGSPGSTVLSTSRLPARRIPDLGGRTFISIPIRRPVDVLAGDEFAIVLSNRFGSCSITKGPPGDSYPDGKGFFEALPNDPGFIPLFSSSPDPALDLPFVTRLRIEP